MRMCQIEQPERNASNVLMKNLVNAAWLNSPQQTFLFISLYLITGWKHNSNIRFAAHVFKFSCFRTIKIQPSPKRFDMVDVTMMWRGRTDFPAEELYCPKKLIWLKALTVLIIIIHCASWQPFQNLRVELRRQSSSNALRPCESPSRPRGGALYADSVLAQQRIRFQVGSDS